MITKSATLSHCKFWSVSVSLCCSTFTTMTMLDHGGTTSLHCYHHFISFILCLTSISITHVAASIHDYQNETFIHRANSFFIHGGSEGLYASKLPSSNVSLASEDKFLNGKSFIRWWFMIPSISFLFLHPHLLLAFFFCSHCSISKWVCWICLFLGKLIGFRLFLAIIFHEKKDYFLIHWVPPNWLILEIL